MTHPDEPPIDHERLLREARRQEREPMPEAQPPLTPEQLAPLFPDYDIQALIGRGGMGAVYRAVQRRLGRVVALKVLPAHLAADPEFGERFRREALALASLNHPHVLTVHDFGEAGGIHYLVTEFVDGVNLRQLMELGELSPAEALRITPQICTALQYAHEHGVVHRDVKPENILIDTGGQVKIADFGLAKIAGDRGGLTRSTAVFGTPHYMAPEQWRGSGTVDHRADIYALGVVLYEMLTGELPIGHFDPPSKHRGVPRGLDEVVRRALAQQPENRYQQVRDVQTDVELEARAMPRPVEAAPTATARLVRGPLVAWGIAMAMALALLGTLFVTVESQRRRADAAHAQAAYDATVAAIVDGARQQRAWEGAIPDWPSAPRPLPVSPDVARTVAFAGIPATLILLTVLGFAAIRRIRNARGALRGTALAVTTAWIAPLAIVAAMGFVPISAIRSGDLRIVAGLVFTAALGAGAVWFAVRETRRQLRLVEAGVAMPGGSVPLALGAVLAVVAAIGGALSAQASPAAPEARGATRPLLARHLVGRDAAFVLEQLGPPTTITVSRSGQAWAYRDECGASLEQAVALSGDRVVATDGAARVLLPNPRPTRSPYLGQAFAELVAESGPPDRQSVGALGREFAWSGGLTVSEHDGRVVGIRWE